MTDVIDETSFRTECAAYVKYLLAARERAQPGFITADMRQSWRLAADFPPAHRAVDFLRLAQRKFTYIEQHFALAPGSLGQGDIAPDSVDNLPLLLLWLVPQDDLSAAIATLARGKRLRWGALAQWETLPRIRRALDQLPDSASAPATANEPVPVASRCVQLFGEGQRPIVNGRRKPPLTSNRYRLIVALIEAGEDGCSKSQLEKIAPGYHRSLTDLRNSYPAWGAVIHFPGRPHGRYRID